MADKVKVWFDPEGDFLEVRFSDAPGFMRETAHDALMERVDEHGEVIGRKRGHASRLLPPSKALTQMTWRNEFKVDVHQRCGTLRPPDFPLLRREVWGLLY